MVMNVKENKGVKRSDTPTPNNVCDFIFFLLGDKGFKKILDPACGDGRLTANFTECEKINYDIKQGQDFLLMTEPIDCDLVIVNPPFNQGKGRKFMPELFLDKILELCGKDVGIVMITPMGFRLNQKTTSKRWKKILLEYPPITSIISLPVNCFDDTLFHTEILCFNLPFLKPHYLLPSD